MKQNITPALVIVQDGSALASNAPRSAPGDRLCQTTTNAVSHPPPRAALLPEPHTAPITLNEAEARECSECEEIIRRGWDSFLEVGFALVTIRQKRLYRDRYGTFDDYCRQKWEFSKTHANRLIEAASVSAILTPIGVKLKSESQARPLVGLAPQKIPAAWRKAEELAGDGEVTAKVVRRAAEEFKVGSPQTSRTASARKSRSKATSLEPALKLLAKAEKAFKKGDHQTVLNTLEKLRNCLMQIDQRR